MNPAPSCGPDEYPDGHAQQGSQPRQAKAHVPTANPSAAVGWPTSLAPEILGRLPVAFGLIDLDLKFKWVALPPGRPIPIDAKSLSGAPVEDLLGPQSGAALAALAAVLATGQSYSAEGVPVSWPLGAEPSFWDVSLQPYFEREEVAGVLAFACDASSRVLRSAQMSARIRQLEEQSALQADFLSVASHELRTPLTSLVGYAELLDENLADVLTEDQASFVRHLHDNALRLQHIVDDILDFTRYEGGTFQLDLQQADMREVVQDSLECLERQALAAGVEFEWAQPAEPVFLRADPIRLGQVILNLLGNALKFTQSGGQIAVTIKAAGGKVRVEIRDSGIGIPRSHLSKLFNKFYQVSSKRTDRKGAGLGLAICKTLIEAHGGQIGVRSRPGRGSTFWFTIPTEGPPAWQTERQLKLFA